MVLRSEIIDKAVKKFKPIIYLDSQSNYFPIDFNDYIREAKLKDAKTGEVITNNYLTPEKLNTLINKYPYLNNENYTLFLPDGKNSSVFKRKSEYELEQTPLYVSILPTKDPNEFYIRYIHMYAYNGDIKVGCCFKTGSHYADKEHITVHVRYNSIIRDTEIVRIYYSRHSGGVWLDPNSSSNNPDDIIQFNDSHPVVYSAYHSHASYNNDLTNHYRFWCFVKDPCDKGYLWNPKRLIVLEDNNSKNKDTQWINFRGDLGNGHVANLPDNNWWVNPDKEGNYKQNCWWCFK